MCEQACPCDAVELTTLYDLTGLSRKEMMFDKEKLLSVFDETVKAGTVSGAHASRQTERGFGTGGPEPSLPLAVSVETPSRKRRKIRAETHTNNPFRQFIESSGGSYCRAFWPGGASIY